MLKLVSLNFLWQTSTQLLNMHVVSTDAYYWSKVLKYAKQWLDVLTDSDMTNKKDFTASFEGTLTYSSEMSL